MTSRSIPLADLARLDGAARRTRRLRLFSAAALVVVATLALAVSLETHPRTSSFLPQGTNGIVVLDVSASISADTYARIRATLDRLASSGGRYGLVVFSDTAYQALPPGTPARELRAFERLFAVPRQTTPGTAPVPRTNPWSDQFSAGTRISTGLGLALDVVRAERIGRPGVVLVSDLDDDTQDLQALTSVALAYRKLGIPLRVVGLDPAPEDDRLVTQLLEHPGDLRLAPTRGGNGTARVDALSTVLLVALTLGAAACLALLLTLCERLRWSEA